MSLLSSLDRKDRRLLFYFLGMGIGLAILTGVLMPNRSRDENPMPSTYLAGQHGARAAYETLLRSGYPLERWERPLTELAAQAGPDTVVVFAEPFPRESEDFRAVRQIVERGGRVLATGFQGGILLPGNEVAPSGQLNLTACKLEPEGFDPLAGAGEAWMRPEATWKPLPAHHVQFGCAAQPAVVEYDWGKGHVIWWAGSTPLENGSLSRAQNLDLLLDSLGPRQGRHFYWDESLHGEVRSDWSYAAGPSLTLLQLGLPVLGLLIVFSFSRRSGPVRDLPPPARATPIEFLEALGALYRHAGAASTAVAIAWDRFRRQCSQFCGQPGAKLSASELASLLRRRFPALDSDLEADLAACEDAAGGDEIRPRQALQAIQSLHKHRMQISAGLRAGSKPHPQERAS